MRRVGSGETDRKGDTQSVAFLTPKSCGTAGSQVAVESRECAESDGVTATTGLGLIEAWNPHGKPGAPACAANQQHWARTLARWQRRQHIVDVEVTVGRDRDARRVRIALGKRGRGFTNQGGKYNLARRSAGIIAAT